MRLNYEKAVIVMVRADLHEAIRELSKRRQVPVSVMVREFLKAELAKEEKRQAAA